MRSLHRVAFLLCSILADRVLAADNSYIPPPTVPPPQGRLWPPLPPLPRGFPGTTPPPPPPPPPPTTPPPPPCPPTPPPVDIEVLTVQTELGRRLRAQPRKIEAELAASLGVAPDRITVETISWPLELSPELADHPVSPLSTLPSGAPAPVGGRFPLRVVAAITIALTVGNVDYAQLNADAALKTSFENSIKDAVAEQAGSHITASHVAVQLSAGSVVVLATLSPPAGVNTKTLITSLDMNKVALETRIEAVVSLLKGIIAVTSAATVSCTVGTVAETSITTPLAELASRLTNYAMSPAPAPLYGPPAPAPSSASWPATAPAPAPAPASASAPATAPAPPPVPVRVSAWAKDKLEADALFKALDASATSLAIANASLRSASGLPYGVPVPSASLQMVTTRDTSFISRLKAEPNDYGKYIATFLNISASAVVVTPPEVGNYPAFSPMPAQSPSPAAAPSWADPTWPPPTWAGRLHHSIAHSVALQVPPTAPPGLMPQPTAPPFPKPTAPPGLVPGFVPHPFLHGTAPAHVPAPAPAPAPAPGPAPGPAAEINRPWIATWKITIESPNAAELVTTLADSINNPSPSGNGKYPFGNLTYYFPQTLARVPVMPYPNFSAAPGFEIRMPPPRDTAMNMGPDPGGHDWDWGPDYTIAERIVRLREAATREVETGLTISAEIRDARTKFVKAAIARQQALMVGTGPATAPQIRPPDIPWVGGYDDSTHDYLLGDCCDDSQTYPYASANGPWAPDAALTNWNRIRSYDSQTLPAIPEEAKYMPDDFAGFASLLDLKAQAMVRSTRFLARAHSEATVGAGDERVSLHRGPRLRGMLRAAPPIIGKIAG